MKENIKLVLIILSIVLVYGNLYYEIFSPYGNIDTSYRVEDFEKYKNDYENVCDEIVKIAKSNGFDVNEGDIYFFDDIASSEICCTKKAVEYICYGDRKISNTVSNSFEKIAESFPKGDHSEFSCVYYSKDFIGFTSESGRYSIVFSVNNKRPTDKCNPYGTEEIKIRTKKIQKNWYHVWQ